MKTRNSVFSFGVVCVLLSIAGFGLAIVMWWNHAYSTATCDSIAMVALVSFILSLTLGGRSLLELFLALQLNTQLNREASRRFVSRLFFRTFFWPVLIFTLVIFTEIIWIGGYKGIAIALMVALATFFVLPSGLPGFFCHSTDVFTLSVIGFSIYAALFTLAFFRRKYWQTTLLWIILVLLMVVNVMGCHAVAGRVPIMSQPS